MHILWRTLESKGNESSQDLHFLKKTRVEEGTEEEFLVC